MTGDAHKLDKARIAELGLAATVEGWPLAALGICDADVLVADPALMEMLTSLKGERKTQIIEPAEFDPKGLDGAARVFVMLLKGELAYVRGLQKQHPKQAVISVSYGPKGSTVDLASIAAQGMELTAVISSPCSGADYLERIIEANKMATVALSLTPAETLWATCQHDFDLVRSLAGKVHGKQGHVVAQIGLDLVDHLRSKGLLPFRKFKSVALAVDAQVISMTRRNRADQVALMYKQRQAQMSGAADLPEPDAQTLMPFALELIAAEARYEILFAKLPSFRSITFEELSESPVEVVKMLSSFFGQKSLKKVSVVDPAAAQLHVAWKDSFRAQYKQAMVNFLGLSKNKHGSYQTKTEQIRSS